ncbi:MAG TPA: bifunctional (p)ppGpp synthetase/guanosine-3',5'-bis(diphosphate) 3'-pyrophosphohydrolase [Patescibacteria group bacterium]|nr:bifunctional (p)ppGpp synthetase/guanosine-3',5'-bis(diphosphate) 3'-pyrophosphohydrolase [Patescibacteria group bacterium]
MKTVTDEYIIGKDVERDLNLLLRECRTHLPRVDENRIRKAFYFCVDAHKKDVRASGEPYYTHPLEVALIVIDEIPLDDDSVIAALLHDVVEDTEYTLKDIRAEFGASVAEIVDGATKINDIFKSHEIKQAENYRKLLLSMVNDVRVILVKFADRLHNMRTLEYVKPEKQQRIARETLDIYAPFAHRFGLGRIKWELEDLAFKYLNRAAYDDIKKQLSGTRRDRQDYIKNFAAPIEERLKEHNIKFEINGRPKHIYSIYNKMIARDKGFDELYDLFAVRVILDTDDNNDCFLAYGIISEIYTPVPERFKNYISVPKKNGYQSLHTTVIGNDGKRVEVQIRTREMHEIAEQGVAAHFKYKAETVKHVSWVEDKDLEEWANWVRDVFENAGDGAHQEVLESFKLNLYQDEIYIFTPKGELRIIPKGSTPVDFAFEIHTQVGYRCIGAKVNGKIVPLDYKLHTGDQVEILTSKNQTPNRDWERFVITHKAKSQIRKFLNEEKRIKQVEGREIWMRRAKKINLHINDDDLEKTLVSLKFESPAEFYFAIGSGTLNVDIAAEMIREKIAPGAPAMPQFESTPTEKKFDTFKKVARDSANGIYITSDGKSSSGVLYSYAKCCNPVPGDDIVGVVTIGTGIKVHRRVCKNAIEMMDKIRARVVDLQWSQQEQGDFIAAVRITGEDRAGMLSDITSAIVSINNTNIRSVNIDAFESVFEGVVMVYVRNVDHLGVVFDRLRKIKGVKSVERFEG